MNKLRFAYNSGLRRIMSIPHNNSASEMVVYLNVPSFGELVGQNEFNFKSRVLSCKNNEINGYFREIYYILHLNIYCIFFNLIM